MVKYSVHYFNLRARGELARLVCVAGKLDWEDCRIEFKDWPQHKDKAPMGQLPYLSTDDGKVLTQSLAIAEYLAQVAGLAASDPFCQARERAMVQHFWDATQMLIKIRFDAKTDEAKAEYKKSFDEKLTFMLDKLEKNHTDKDFFCDKMSWVDLALADQWLWWSNTNADMLAKYPKLSARVKRVNAVPEIAAYIAKRPETEA